VLVTRCLTICNFSFHCSGILFQFNIDREFLRDFCRVCLGRFSAFHSEVFELKGGFCSGFLREEMKIYTIILVDSVAHPKWAVKNLGALNLISIDFVHTAVCPCSNLRTKFCYQRLNLTIHLGERTLYSKKRPEIVLEQSRKLSGTDGTPTKKVYHKFWPWASLSQCCSLPEIGRNAMYEGP
jgi:hypothetical protein